MTVIWLGHIPGKINGIRIQIQIWDRFWEWSIRSYGVDKGFGITQRKGFWLLIRPAREFYLVRRKRR